jgi:hypothetical protein
VILVKTPSLFHIGTEGFRAAMEFRINPWKSSLAALFSEFAQTFWGAWRDAANFAVVCSGQTL